MSWSESATGYDTLAALAALAESLETRVDEALAVGDPDMLPSELTLQRVISAAARLHARYGESHGRSDPLREDVTPTEAVDLACALLRARDLNPFDLALWFSAPT